MHTQAHRETHTHRVSFMMSNYSWTSVRSWNMVEILSVTSLEKAVCFTERIKYKWLLGLQWDFVSTFPTRGWNFGSMNLYMSWMCFHNIYEFICLIPAVSGRCWFLEVIHIPWPLQSFCLLFRIDLCAFFWVKGVIETSHLELSVSKSLTPHADSWRSRS